MEAKSSALMYKQSKSILFSIGIWGFAGLLYLLIRFLGTSETEDWAHNFELMFYLWLAGSHLLGIMFWFSSKLCDSERIRKKTYRYILFIKTTSLVIGSIIILLMTRITAYLLGHINLTQILPTFLERLTDETMLVFLLYVATTGALYSFFVQMSLIIGPTTLINIFLGRYHHPKNENRIFMFLDLKSSSTHAEKLGNAVYSNLIQDCFHDLTECTKKYPVEIYQYVGDEAILTWKVSPNKNYDSCINLFFDFKQLLIQKEKYYSEKYGLVPEFKAGVNLGSVTVAEVGGTKRNIAYLSDVLNTASRLQQKCNELGRSLLITDAVRNVLSNSNTFTIETIGNLDLEGKQQKIDVFSVHNTSLTESY